MSGDIAVVDAKPTVAVAPDPAPAGRWRRLWARCSATGRRADLYAALVYLLGALYVTERLWRHLHTFILSLNATDQIQFEYFAQHAVRVVSQGENPFFASELNAPDGVNLMANTATLGLHLPFAPVTMLFGANVSFAVELTVSLAASAIAWYWLFSRHLVKSRFAAFVGGAFCGFAPGMMSQANAHPNITAQFLIPVIIWRVIRLRDREHVWRNRLVLTALVVYQMFLNEEVLFATAMAMFLFVGTWALQHRAEARAEFRFFLSGLASVGAIALVLLAYPLYFQFFGPQVYHGMWGGSSLYGNDIGAFASFAQGSFAGFKAGAGPLSANPTEQSSFFGWPLLVLTGYLVVLFWRNTVARAAAVAGLVMAVLSLGPRMQIFGHHTNIPGPYWPFTHITLFDSVISGRLVLLVIPVIALLLALWVDKWLAGAGTTAWRPRFVALGLVAAALLPVAPTPLHITSRLPTPRFFTSGEWRSMVPKGRSVVTVPITSLLNAMDGMQWATDENLDFNQAGGYFLGPDRPGGRGMFGAPFRHTDKLLNRVMNSGKVPDITAADRSAAVADLRHWRAAIVVLEPHKKHAAALQATTTALLGISPEFRHGVWVWDVRSL
jgi:hypothetical protein